MLVKIDIFYCTCTCYRVLSAIQGNGMDCGEERNHDGQHGNFLCVLIITIL